MALVMGVDSSTRSTKVEVRDADDGRLVASAVAEHPPTSPPRSEQNPAAWWDALKAAASATAIRDIAALSVAAQQQGLVALDAAGAVLRPAKLWNDTESAPEAEAMVKKVGGERWAATCGSVPVAAFPITKLAWLADHEPATFARLGTLLQPHDYLIYRLTGRLVTDRGDASGTGYWSPAEERWLPDVLDRVIGSPPGGAESWLQRLPEVLGPEEPSDYTVASAHDFLGLRGRPLCGPGTGDTMAAALGSGMQPGDVAVSVGSSGAVMAVTDEPTKDGSGAVAGFADATGRFLPLVSTLNAAGVNETFARLLGVDLKGLERLALRCDPGSGGVVLVPHLAGERTPNRPDATGTISGLRPDSTREQLARAAFEGVICSLLEGLDALRAAGVDCDSGRLLLIGGGARSSAFRRILADLSGRAVTVAHAEELTAAGACVQAAAVLHERPPAEVAQAWGLATGPAVEPQPAAVDSAGAVRAQFREALNIGVENLNSMKVVDK
ncbi:MAG: xylulokinase [Acidimicrobiia bacterium]